MSLSLILKQVLYMIFGLIGMISNGFITFIIVKCKALHFNAYYLAATMALADMINSIAFLCSGAYRLHLIITNQTEVRISPWECIYVPATHFFVIGYHSASMLVLMIACDRLLSIITVHFYSRLGRRYTSGLIAFCVLYALGVWTYFTIDMTMIVPKIPSTTKFCFDIYSESVHLYDYYSVPSFLTGAVLIMMVIIIILRKQSNTKSIHPKGPQATAVARNAKISRLLSFISFNTFLMWVVPQVAISVIDAFSQENGLLSASAQFLWMLQPLHGLTNLIIYFRKGGQFRKAFNDLRNRVHTTTVTIQVIGHT